MILFFNYVTKLLLKNITKYKKLINIKQWENKNSFKLYKNEKYKIIEIKYKIIKL